MSKDDEIRAALEAAFQPVRLEVINESARHASHAGADASGESHYRVRIEAAALSGMPRLARHRAVHEALGKELMASIHALALEIG
ncbi:MAG: BolA family transcriptional regulator [Maritimibacter sp.]